MVKIRVRVPAHYKIVNGRKVHVRGYYKRVDVDPWNIFSIKRKGGRRYR
jgi:hypothetical protein